jgi:hypothetical protein
MVLLRYLYGVLIVFIWYLLPTHDEISDKPDTYVPFSFYEHGSHERSGSFSLLCDFRVH